MKENIKEVNINNDDHNIKFSIPERIARVYLEYTHISSVKSLGIISWMKIVSK